MVSKEIRGLVAVWSARALLRPHAFKMLAASLPGEDDVLRAIGLDDLIDREISRRELKKRLTLRLKEIESGPLTRKGRFFQNLNRLGDTLGLSVSEREVLIFSVLAREETVIRRAMEYFGNISLAQIIGELAAILKIKPSLIRKALSKSAALHSSGLLQIDHSPHLGIPDRMDTLEGFGGAIIEEDFETALSGYFHKSPVAKLGIRDFPHVEKDLSILRPFLKKSLKARMAGVNILLYGLPGTGKTELVRMLAEEMGIKLFEVSSQDEDGDPADSDQRFRSYLLCQKLFAKTNNCLILFDEVEDVFPVDDFVFFGPHRRTGNNKAWTNRLLENNPVPAIWVSNSVS
jgi:hypothetical protein